MVLWHGLWHNTKVPGPFVTESLSDPAAVLQFVYRCLLYLAASGVIKNQ